MPTVIVLDVSLSMCRTYQDQDNVGHSVRDLAVAGLNAFADTVAQNCKLEFTTLMAYSSLWERLVPFTRDYDQIKAALLELDSYYDKTNLVNVLNGVNEIVTEEWGSQVPINLILVTDGYAGIDSLISPEKLPAFAFPCKLNVMIIGSQNDPGVQTSITVFEKLVEMAKASCTNHQHKPKQDNPEESDELKSTAGHNRISIYEKMLKMAKANYTEHKINSDIFIRYPENNELTMKSVKQMFVKLAESNYQYFKGMLHCGSLSSPTAIYPPIESFSQYTDTGNITATPSTHIEIYGFMELADIASPPVHSRHLVFAAPMTKEQLLDQPSILTIGGVAGENSNLAGEIDESLTAMAGDAGRQPSLCVLLHGALKVEGMIALCKVGEPDWFGMLYSWADSKKKFNLMLSTFNCGSDAVKWLGDLKHFGRGEKHAEFERRPKSYQQGQQVTVWIKPNSMQSDIQKILRLAKRLPDKASNFYKELTKFRKAAVSSGFYSAMDALGVILERESAMIMAAAPEAGLQLTHAINALRSRELTERDLEADILPLQIKTDPR